MKKLCLIILIFFASFKNLLNAQCSLCTKTASQLGDESAQGLNSAIVYLMFTPLAIMFFIGYKWYKREKQNNL